MSVSVYGIEPIKLMKNLLLHEFHKTIIIIFFADFRIKFQSNIQLDNASCLGLCNWQGKDLLLLEWFEQIPVGYKSNSIWLFVTEKSIKELLYPVFTAVNLQ